MGDHNANHGTSDADDADRRPLSAERIRELIRVALARHPAVESVREIGSIQLDRLNVDVVDKSRLMWRVAIMRQPRSVGGGQR